MGARFWGTTPAEEVASYRCAEIVGEPALVRAVDVAAPADLVWRWLRQLRVAPYSYDLVDNLGRRSPRRLTPDLRPWQPGQTVMMMFTVAEVDDADPRRRSVTLVRRDSRLLALVGPVAMTYVVAGPGTGPVRLLGTLATTAGTGSGPVSRLVGWVVGWGDLVMMRKQLRTLAAHAERDARAGVRPGAP